MPPLTQAELDLKAEKLTTNGVQAVAQAILSGVYGPEKLTQGAQLRTTWKASQRAADLALFKQKEATRFEAEMRAEANKDVVSLSEMSRTLFADEEPVLTLLGLTPTQETVTGPDGQPIGTVAARPSESTAETLARWRAQLGNAQALTGSPAERLTGAGWPLVRLGRALEKVEAYARAEMAQQTAIRAAQEASDQQAQDFAALRQWYTTAAAICKQTIKDADATNHQQLLELLGLD